MSSEIIKHTAQPDLVRTRTKSFELLLSDLRQIIKEGMQKAYQRVDAVMVHTYWLIEQRIVEDEQKLLLCAETSKDVARYSILNDNKQLYAAKYLTFMPTEEELTREIEYQKEIYRLKDSYTND